MPVAAVLCHGNRGYKDWGFFPLLASRLAEEGIATATFNLSGSGITDREGTFGEPERFRGNTYGRELEDLARVVDWIVSRRLARGGADPIGDPPRIGLIGHSRGGAIAILHAAQDARIRCLTTLAAPSRIGVWPEHYFEAWRRGEPARTHDFRTRSELPLGPEIYRDLGRNRDRYDVLQAVERLKCPLLILQGDRDRSVSIDEAREIASHAAAASTELHVIEGAGHSFQAGDKIRRTPPQLLDMVERVTAWMRRWLIGGVGF
ncbi:MAG TPA: alpha/beta fold hydrolase [Planctomycetota bacterium]|nr:alpha/beta fold hydrolase [Planctomycetota bacterium]